MKIAILISRFLLGMGFIIFGLNILHPFLTSPPPPEGSLAAQFVAVMVPSHWIGLVGVLQLLGGLLLVIGSDRAIGTGCAWTHSR
jgi:uncharacterized membrane protein YphA (DoxX/SURF4 family)